MSLSEVSATVARVIVRLGLGRLAGNVWIVQAVWEVHVSVTGQTLHVLFW
jgi:hypothetical protein